MGMGSPMKRRGQLRMIERAIKQGWNTPPAERERAAELIAEILADPDATTRERLRACEVGIAMEQTCIDDDKNQIGDPHGN